MRTTSMLTAALLLIAACGDGSTTQGGSAPTSGVPSTSTAPSTPIAGSAPPTTVFATNLDEACWNATDAAYNSSVRLGLWDGPPTPEVQAEYYRSRVQEVEELIAAFDRIGPGAIPPATWDAALADLSAYRDWAQQNVTTIEATSSTVSNMSPDSIWAFRGRMTGACGDVFDIN